MKFSSDQAQLEPRFILHSAFMNRHLDLSIRPVPSTFSHIIGILLKLNTVKSQAALPGSISGEIFSASFSATSFSSAWRDPAPRNFTPLSI